METRSLAVWKRQVDALFVVSSSSTSSAGLENFVGIKPATLSGRNVDTKTCSSLRVLGGCRAPTSSTPIRFASVATTALPGPWRAYSASNVASKSLCSRLSLGFQLSLRLNLSVLAPRYASSRLRTSYGHMFNQDFLPIRMGII